MKKVFFLLTMMIFGFSTKAQVKTPQSSPKSLLHQVVGLTDVDVEYSRPSARGRAVFGDLVPFGRIWRTGANANTTISFSEDVIIDGKTLKGGKYALYTNPKAEVWEVIFYKDTDNWGIPEKWDETKVALRVNAKPESLCRKVETLTIDISNLELDSANLEISWEKIIVSVKFEVPTQKNTMASIEKVIAGPTAADYFASSQYIFQANIDLNKSLEYINKAIAMTKTGEDIPFWYLRLKSLIQAKLGDKRGAIDTAKLSLAGAEKKNNADYIKMNKDSILEWNKK